MKSYSAKALNHKAESHKLPREFITKCYTPDASKDLHAPSGDSIPSFKNCAVVLGFMQMLVPPTIAASHCPVRMARSA